MATNSYGWAQPQTFGAGYRGYLGARKAYPDAFGQQESWTPPPSRFRPNADPVNPPGTRVTDLGGRTFDQYRAQGEQQRIGGNGWQNPGMPQQNWNPPPQQQWNGGSGADDILKAWNGMQGGPKDWNNPSFYANKDNRDMMENYTNNYAVPMMNAELAKRTQSFNEFSNQRDFGEQQFVNRGQMDLAYRGNNREDEALRFGQMTNQRDFGEGKRQFDTQFGLQQELGRGQLQATNYGNQTQRIGVEGGLRNDAFANQTGRLNVQNQFTLGQGQLSNDARRIGNDFTLGQGQLRNQEFANQTDLRNVNNQFTLGQGQLQNQGYANQTDRYAQEANARFQQGQLGLGRFSNDTERMNVQNQYNLGNYSNQTQRLGVEGGLANDRYANEALAARYQGQTANEQFANQTALTGVQNQYSLGQGQLGFQNRQLDTDEAFRRSQLAQEADLTRERYRNDLIQARYASMGRANDVNQRAIRQWA